jgi:uroporphyrin-III C-methyltransferase
MPPGKAYLVGAGPGNPDLITVRGLRLLQSADVVVYDHLVAPALLEEAAPHAERIFVGKESGYHLVQQGRINHLLVEHVRRGKQVVRLKGGDPFVFGRGGEEALALVTAGLPFEVVPGISSALAVPAYAGIPVTQRGVATAFAVVTGHEAAHLLHQTTDWSALARIPTLIILMGVRWIATVSEALVAAGRAAETPTAIICSGTTAEQRVVRTTLAALPDTIATHRLHAPAVIVVGEVVALADELAWFLPDSAPAGFVSLLEEEQKQ